MTKYVDNFIRVLIDLSSEWKKKLRPGIDFLSSIARHLPPPPAPSSAPGYTYRPAVVVPEPTERFTLGCPFFFSRPSSLGPGARDGGARESGWSADYLERAPIDVRGRDHVRHVIAGDSAVGRLIRGDVFSNNCTRGADPIL